MNPYPPPRPTTFVARRGWLRNPSVSVRDFQGWARLTESGSKSDAVALTFDIDQHGRGRLELQRIGRPGFLEVTLT